MAKSATSVETHSCAIGGERQGQTANIHIARPARDFDQAVRPLWAARQSAHLEWNGGYAERVAQIVRFNLDLESDYFLSLSG